MAEPRIVAILRADGGWLPAEQLLDAYCKDGASRWTGYNAVTTALRNGWIERDGKRGAFRYRLASTAPSEVIDGRSLHTHKRRRVTPPPATEAAKPYAGPVFDRDPLTPSLGLVCDPEVMPLEVGCIIDSLHRQFHEVFMGVE